MYSRITASKNGRDAIKYAAGKGPGQNGRCVLVTTVNMMPKAYESGAIVLILCSEMDQARLSSALMQLITMDIRNFVSGRLNGTIDMKRKAFVFYDEFSSYTSSVPLIKSLYARARSADVVISLATQSVSDYALVDESYFHVLADNSDSIISFRQHGLGLIRARAAHDPKYALLNSAINEILEIIRDINTCDDDSQDVSYLIYYLDRRYEAFRRYTAVLPYI